MKKPVDTREIARRSNRLVALAAMAAVGLSGCIAKTPKGQVVAVVNGEEITAQDLQAEQRAANAPGADARALVQRVVNRVLLAQAAHRQKLDAYPGFPADVLRLRQDFLVQKLIQSDVKAPQPPTPAQIEAFIASHPELFAHRMRITLDEVRFQAVDDLKSLQGADTLTAITARLKSLNAAPEQGSRTVDTAQLPSALAQKLMSLSPGEVIFIKDRNVTVAAAVRERAAVDLSPADAQALARQTMMQLAVQAAVGAKVKTLRSGASISYQNGYGPAPEKTENGGGPAGNVTGQPGAAQT